MCRATTMRRMWVTVMGFMDITHTGVPRFMILAITQLIILILSRPNAFDVDSQKMIWSVQSKAENPESIEKSSKEYTKLLMSQFEKDRKK